jgi:5-methyltetrahydrofolate--homocysteine methyltransferase
LLISFLITDREGVENIFDILKQKKVLLLDGAMGTELQKRALQPGEPPEIWNITHSEVVYSIHKAYVGAGSDIVITNTFGANPIKLKKSGIEQYFEKINSSAVAVARSSGSDYVFGNIGPTGEFIEPLGELKKQHTIDMFKKQAEILYKAGVDGFIIETMMDVEEAACAVQAVKDFKAPVFSCMTFQKTRDGGFRTIMGQTPENVAKRLRDEGADAVGTNCGLTSSEMVNLIKKIATAVDIPIIAEPNAGLPKMKNGVTIFEQTPKDFASQLKFLIDAGASIIGGCCGTTAEFIGEAKKQLRYLC